MTFSLLKRTHLEIGGRFERTKENLCVYSVLLLLNYKLDEEKGLEERFGSDYLEYKKKDPFSIPRFWKGIKPSFLTIP